MEIKNSTAPAEAEYTAAVIGKMPRVDDPREVAIVEKLKTCLLKEEWAKSAFATIRERQIAYMREVLAKNDDPDFVYGRTQAVLKEISELLHSKIVEGKELLQEIPKGNPTLLMTNHLGTYKLAGVKLREELGLDIPGFDFMYPSPLFFAGLSPVAERIGNDLVYVSDDFPGILGKIHRESGFIHVPPQTAQQTGRTAYLLGQTREAFEARPNTALVNYPEGATTGKYSGKGPYDLEPFKTGGYVIAAQLGVRVVPVTQYFDPEKGLQLKVFPSYIPEASGKEAMAERAEPERKAMQQWLDARQAAPRSGR